MGIITYDLTCGGLYNDQTDGDLHNDQQMVICLKIKQNIL